MKRTLIFLLLIGGLFALIGGGGAVQVQGQGTSPLGIVPEPSELQVSIWVDKPAYRVGEEIVIHFWINRPAWVYIIDIDAAGYARLIFPNRFDRDNYIDQAGEYSLPGPSDPYRFVVVPPTGTEYLQIIASTQPLPLDVQGFREAFPLLGTDPGQVGAQIQGIIPRRGGNGHRLDQLPGLHSLAASASTADQPSAGGQLHLGPLLPLGQPAGDLQCLILLRSRRLDHRLPLGL